jgi:hypothetical protein
MEGISNEAASLAGHWGLGKLIVFYDDNRISIDGNTDISFTEDVSARYEALGWHVQHVVVRYALLHRNLLGKLLRKMRSKFKGDLGGDAVACKQRHSHATWPAVGPSHLCALRCTGNLWGVCFAQGHTDTAAVTCRTATTT